MTTFEQVVPAICFLILSRLQTFQSLSPPNIPSPLASQTPSQTDSDACSGLSHNLCLVTISKGMNYVSLILSDSVFLVIKSVSELHVFSFGPGVISGFSYCALHAVYYLLCLFFPAAGVVVLRVCTQSKDQI